VGRQHNVSRQRARDLRAEFRDYLGIKFRDQRFLKRGRGRRGPEGPQPGPVAGA